jgi:2'-5' RNA ligase
MRLFIAVPIPQELREKIGGLGKEIEQDGIKCVGPKNMHLTLKFIGETDKVEDIRDRLKAVRFSGFICEAKGIGVFPSEDYIRVVWVGVQSEDKMEALAKKVQDVCKGYGKKDDRFSSHITMARVKRKVDLKDFLGKHKDDGLGSFQVDSFELIKSELQPGGPEYTVIESFPVEDKDA